MNTKVYTLTCPHCGESYPVEVFDFKWHEADYKFWSTGWVEGDEWYAPSYVQCCPKCNHFYATPRVDGIKLSEMPWRKENKLSYTQLKRAHRELADGDEQEANVRLEMFWAYYEHDWFQDYPTGKPSISDIASHKANMVWLICHYSDQTTSFSHLIFELNRLLGNKDECEKMIKDLTYDKYVVQIETRDKERGLKTHLSERTVRSMYEQLIEELKYALTQPALPYVKN